MTDWTLILWYRILLVPVLPFMAGILQGSTWTGWIIRYIGTPRRYFYRTMQFSVKTMPQFTQLELFNYGLNNIKVNFSNFSASVVSFGN
jgi:hypothetical protein